MKYVGATNWFIRWPFLLEGLFLGFIGGFIADILLIQFYEFLTVSIHKSLAFCLWSASFRLCIRPVALSLS